MGDLIFARRPQSAGRPTVCLSVCLPALRTTRCSTRIAHVTAVFEYRVSGIHDVIVIADARRPQVDLHSCRQGLTLQSILTQFRTLPHRWFITNLSVYQYGPRSIEAVTVINSETGATAAAAALTNVFLLTSDFLLAAHMGHAEGERVALEFILKY